MNLTLKDNLIKIEFEYNLDLWYKVKETAW